MIATRTWLALGVAAICSISVDASAAIPYDDQLTPGELRGIAWEPGDEWGYGYWEYLPTAFDELGAGETLPLLVFLPGIGEYDDDPACPGGALVCTADACGNDGLCRNLTWGPQLLIRNGDWDEDARPYIVISPQHPVPPLSVGDWDIDALEAFFAWVVDNYPVDPRRLYLTGMSQGGRCTLSYTAAYPRRFAAAVPMPGGVVQPSAISCSFQDTAFWAFHGESDNNANLGAGTFSPCEMVELVDMYEHPEDYPQFEACVDAVGRPHPPARMTMFDNVGHSSWVQAIDPIGSGWPASEWPSDQGCGIDAPFREYTAALDSDGVYSWLATLDRPDVVAPDDLELPGDVVSTSIVAEVTDDDAVTVEWTQTAGPPATLVVADAAELELDDLAPETEYAFGVYVVDADGQWDRDEVILTMLEMPAGESGTGVDATGDASTGTPGTGSASADGTDGDASGPTASDATLSAGDGDDEADDDDDDTTGGDPGEDDESSGCGCTADEPGARASWLALAVFALRRRRVTSCRSRSCRSRSYHRPSSSIHSRRPS
jgi:MYXO-CTERM domain-containing protein